jgi:hypothetical protein
MSSESTRLDGFPVLRPLKDADELKHLQAVAARDNHLVLAPTFVVEKEGRIVGYIGLNSLPLFQGWFDTNRMGPRDSLTIFNAVENFCRMQGMKQLGLLLPLTSPFTGRTKELGYEHISTVGLELKKL